MCVGGQWEWDTKQRNISMVLTKYIENDCGKRNDKQFFFSFFIFIRIFIIVEVGMRNTQQMMEWERNLLLFYSCARSTMRETIIKPVYWNWLSLTYLGHETSNTLCDSKCTQREIVVLVQIWGFFRAVAAATASVWCICVCVLGKDRTTTIDSNNTLNTKQHSYWAFLFFLFSCV